MAHTNSTENYGLPQWIGTDKPTFLGDFNSAFATIDAGMKASADVATSAAATANAAGATATSAATNATNAISIANNAASEAASATSAASSASSTANTAKTTADSAMRASASNTIENLAPAYDPTLTYNVGDLVTFIDAQNSGKLYKCIVAVNTPMDFNINYWDDVTTSEVYLPIDRSRVQTIAAVTTDGVMSYESLFETLMNNVVVDPTLKYYLTRYEPTNRITRKYNSEYINESGNQLTFSYIEIQSGNTIIASISMSALAGSFRTTAINNTSGTVTYTEDISTVATAGYTWTLSCER